MKFLRTRRYPGGALGEITKAIAEIQSSLEQLKAVYPILLRDQGNSASIEFIGDYGGYTEGNYAFKIRNGKHGRQRRSIRPAPFTVNVLGGTAQTLGGTPYVYDDEELSDVEEGWHIYVVYENLEPAPSFTEYGEWRPGIKASSETDMADYTAPHDLVFEIGRISKKYYRNVRQDHKGNIVMPAISNVVDIQTQLPYELGRIQHLFGRPLDPPQRRSGGATWRPLPVQVTMEGCASGQRRWGPCWITVVLGEAGR